MNHSLLYCYAYVAMRSNAPLHKGLCFAQERSEALLFLQQNNIIPLILIRLPRQFLKKHIASFFTLFYYLARHHTNPLRALESIQAFGSYVHRAVAQNIIEHIQQGLYISESFLQLSSFIHPLPLNLLQHHGHHNNFIAVLKEIIDFYEQNYAMEAKIQTKKLYPFILIMFFGVTLYMLLSTMVSLSQDLNVNSQNTWWWMQCIHNNTSLHQDYIILGVSFLAVGLLASLMHLCTHEIILKRVPFVRSIYEFEQYYYFFLLLYLSCDYVQNPAHLVQVAREHLPDRIKKRQYNAQETILDHKQAYRFLSEILAPMTHPWVAPFVHSLKTPESLKGGLKFIATFYQRTYYERKERLQRAIEPLMLILVIGVLFTIIFIILEPLLNYDPI